MSFPLPYQKRGIYLTRISILIIFLAVSSASYAQAPGGVSSGLNVWLKADAGVSSTTNGALLSFWNDQSVNGNNATQVIANSRPQYFSNRINGNPVVQTASSKYFDVNLNGINAQNYTIFTVTKRQSGNNFQHIIGVRQTGAYVGLGLGYSGSSLIRFFQYGNSVSLACTSFAGAAEIPTILSAQFDINVGKKVWFIKDGIELTRAGNTKTHYPATGSGSIGRGNDNYGFIGQIAEVIVYNRVLTDAEKKQVHTYLSVKYGLNVPLAQHQFFNDPAYTGDIFGIGKNVASQGLNQTNSRSVNADDIMSISNPSAMHDGDYMIVGNNDATTAFATYSGSNCAISELMTRRWKSKVINTPGTVTVNFDMTGVVGFSGDKLMLIVDANNNGFDDDVPLVGTYSAPNFTVDNVSIADGVTMTVAHGQNIWYAVASGNTSGAVWSSSPTGSPQVLSSFCHRTSLMVKTGITITNDWPSFTCKDFTVSLGAIWNASSGTINIEGIMTVDGTFNAQTSTIMMNGTNAQSIRGTGISNVYNLTVNNASGVSIPLGSGGVRARNIVSVLSGTLNTNGGLILISDVASTGMISSLTSGSVIGNVTTQRFFNAQVAGWVNLSCAAQGRTVQDWNDNIITTGFVGSDYPPPYSFNNVHHYNETSAGPINTGYIGATNVTNPLTQSRGYMVYMNAGIMNLDVTGSIYSGDQTMPVTYTNTGSVAADGWNLLGNPYPCAIDWNSASWTKTNISNAVYVWNAKLGQYASYVGGVSTNGGSATIPSSQSFFVTANGSNPSLILRENCKTTTQGVFKSLDSDDAVFTLHIANETFSDETSFARNNQGTLHFESEIDAYKMRSPLTEVPYMASISEDGDDLSINSFANFNQEAIIPLRIEVGTTGDYTISHSGFASFANGACIVLEDLLTGAVYPLNAYDEIDLSLQAGSANLRFQLRIGATNLASVTSAGCQGRENGTATIQINNEVPVNVTWMNGQGESILNTIDATMSAGIENLAPGTYYAIIENNGSCGTTQADFVILSDDPLFSNSIITPASCMEEEDGGIALNVMGGTAPYDITWSNGMKDVVLEDVEGGLYTAFVVDAKGCAGSFDFKIPVNSTLTSNFETIADTYELKNGSVLVDFYNTSENAIEYTWTFGDATVITTESNPAHLFNKKGVYEVTLMATNEDCVVYTTKSIKIAGSSENSVGLASEMIGTLTDNGVQIMFFFDQQRMLQINAYNVLGQQLIETIKGVYERQNITFSDRRYAANALIEVVDLKTGERALLRMGI